LGVDSPGLKAKKLKLAGMTSGPAPTLDKALVQQNGIETLQRDRQPLKPLLWLLLYY